MTSSKDIIRLNEYLDGLLSVRESRALEAEMTQKPELAAQLAELQMVFKQIESVDELEPSRDLSVAVLQRLGSTEEKSKTLVWLLSFELLAAAVLAYFAWPTIAASLFGLPGWELNLPEFSDLLNRLAVSQAAIWESIQLSSSSDFTQLLNVPDAAALSADLIWVGLSVALLGLVGNGVLLAGKTALTPRNE